MEPRRNEAGETMPLGVADCWNTIGVPGDRSCPELKRYVHCRNCPVQHSVAFERLTRIGADPDIAGWATNHPASSPGATESLTESAFVFRIGAEWIALMTSVIQEVVEAKVVHSIPHRRAGALIGLVNIRGELIVCASLARLLGLVSATASHPDQSRRLLFICHEQVRVACPVDEVFGIHRFSPTALRNIPETLANATARHSKHLLAWQERSVAFLDVQRLFASLRESLA
jgi:chemotaxis-related protein WspD